MKKTKFTESQIVFALRQADMGVSVAEVCRKMGISEATYYNWLSCPVIAIQVEVIIRPALYRPGW